MRYTLGFLLGALDLHDRNTIRGLVSPVSVRVGNDVGFVLGLTEGQVADLAVMIKVAYARYGIGLTEQLTVDPGFIPASGVTPKSESIRKAEWILVASEEWRSTTRFGQFIAGLEVESLQDVRGNNGSNMLLEGDVVFEPAPDWSLCRRGATDLLKDWMAYRRGYVKAAEMFHARMVAKSQEYGFN